MFLLYILLVLFLLLTAHLFILPLSSKRPVLIKGLEGSFFLVTFFAIIATLTHPFLYLVAVAIGAVIYNTKSWIVYGVSLEDINSAFNRAILATRAQLSNSENCYIIDNVMRVKILNFIGKINLILYKTNKGTNKTKLTSELFRKFIQNYHIKS